MKCYTRVMDITKAKTIIGNFVNQFPVPVGDIANALGIDVYTTTDLPPKTSGSIVKEKDDKFVIYVKSGQPQGRQRFTIAHEIGHFIEHGNELAVGQEMVSPITKKKLALHRPDSVVDVPEEVREREREADQFAADLLMPKDEFTRIWNLAGSLQEVADYFGVSPMAANVRGVLLKLGYFDESI